MPPNTTYVRSSSLQRETERRITKKTTVTTSTLYYLSELISNPDTYGHGPFLNFSLGSGLARNTDPDPAIIKKTVPKAEI
jgi:hypothetical protein